MSSTFKPRKKEETMDIREYKKAMAAIRRQEQKEWEDLVCEAVVPQTTDAAARALKDYDMARAMARARLSGVKAALASRELETSPVADDVVIDLVKIRSAV
jgi:hypothetical protein